MNIFKKKSYSQEQLRFLAILKKWLEDKSTTIIISEGEYCLINEDRSIHIFISHGKVQIANHRFFIKEEMDSFFTDKLMEMVREKRKKDIENIKKEVSLNKGGILTGIFMED